MSAKHFLLFLLALVAGYASLIGPASAQTPPLGYGILHTFQAADSDSRNPDGTYPYSGLTSGSDGYLYGAASGGGSGNQGTIFKVRLDGAGFQTLYSFSPRGSSSPYGNGSGADAVGVLLPGGDGFFYGTAEEGGTNGSGTLFKIRADGTGFAVIHTFSALSNSNTNSDGSVPCKGLTSGGDGFFYGVTQFGGANGDGTVFQVNSDGSVFNTRHSFAEATEGGYVNGPLVALGDGYLYGTTFNGGGSGVYGTVFRVRTDGTGFLVLHPFTATATDGANPAAGLTPGPGGFLYGTTFFGGANKEGTVFKLQPNGSGFQVIYSFSALDGSDHNADGAAPYYSSVTVGADGLLYGSTYYGGPDDVGTVFRVAPDGTGFQTLHGFGTNGTADGSNGAGTPVFGPDGNLYGVTRQGGSGGNGILYRLGPVHTHLLWDTADGRASLWTIDIQGNVAVSPTYGPYSGWKATALATGPDGHSHLLWAHPADGTYSVWDITDPAHPNILPTYGPYTGWSATALTVGSDGVDRLLWNDSQPAYFGKDSPGPTSLWALTAMGDFNYQLYGPYNTWSTAALASSAGGVSHLLWRSTTGTASLWTVGLGGDFLYSPVYGPYPGWQTTSLAVGLQGERELLWTHAADGKASLWRVDAANHQTVFPTTGSYGPYSGYSCLAVTTDPAGTAYLLWSQPSTGHASFWKLDGAGDIPEVGSSTQSVYGPYADGHGGFWAPVAASAGP